MDKRVFAVLALGVFHSATLASAQQEQQRISSSAFTQEQTAVYQAFFADYRQGRSQPWMNVAEVTDILQPDDGDYSGCMKGFPKTPLDKVIHRLTEDFGQQNHLRIVDPRTHKVQDPQDGMRKGQSVESAVKIRLRQWTLDPVGNNFRREPQTSGIPLFFLLWWAVQPQ